MLSSHTTYTLCFGTRGESQSAADYRRETAHHLRSSRLVPPAFLCKVRIMLSSSLCNLGGRNLGMMISQQTAGIYRRFLRLEKSYSNFLKPTANSSPLTILLHALLAVSVSTITQPWQQHTLFPLLRNRQRYINTALIRSMRPYHLMSYFIRINIQFNPFPFCHTASIT